MRGTPTCKWSASVKAAFLPLNALYRSIVVKFKSLATLAVAGNTTVAQVCCVCNTQTHS